MRKTVAAGTAVVIAAGVWAGAPYATGKWAEEALRDNLAALSDHPQLELELTDYQRGWTRSQADSRLTLHGPEQALTFRLHHEIEHGPTFSLPALARVTTTPTIADDRKPMLAHYFGDQPPLRSELRVALSGAQRLTFSSPAFHGPVHNRPALRVDWQGLSGEADIGAGRDRVDLELSAPGLKLSGESDSLAMSGLSVRSQMSEQAPRLWLGDSRVTLAELTMDLPASEAGGRITGRAQGLTGESVFTTGQAEDLLRISTDWGLERARLDGRTFRDGALALELRRIDRAAYREFQARAAQVSSDGRSQEELAEANLALLGELLPRFLARSPEVAITRLSLTTDNGNLEGTADAVYRGDPDPEALPAEPARLLEGVTAHARLKLDKDLVAALLRATAERNLAAKDGIGPERAKEMAPQVAQMRQGMLQGMGILVSEDGHYTLEAAWEEGSVTVNGRPLGMSGGDRPSSPGGTMPGMR